MATGAVKWASTDVGVRRIYAATYAKTKFAATSETVEFGGGTGFATVKAGLICFGGTVYFPGTTGPASVVLGASLDATIGKDVGIFLWGT